MAISTALIPGSSEPQRMVDSLRKVLEKPRHLISPLTKTVTTVDTNIQAQVDAQFSKLQKENS